MFNIKDKMVDKGRVLNEKKGIILDIKKNIKTNTNPYSLSIFNILKSILMKLSNWFLLISTIFTLSACERDKLDPNVTVNTLPNYAPFSIGSTFSFSSSIGSYTNSVLGDTVILGKIYKKVQNTKDEYRTYFIYQTGEYKISGISPMYAGGLTTPLSNFMYLKDNVAVNTAWSVSIPVNSGALKYTARFDFKIMAKDTTHTINGKAYVGVTLVEQKIFNVFAAQELEAGKNMFWFSKGIGLIETDALNTKLANYVIK